jgi:hypothetical protein
MSDRIDQTAIRLAFTGLNLLEEKVKNYSGEKWQQIETRATAIACRLFYLAEYAKYRGAAGCGDHGHEKASKAADKKFKLARKMAGFSYP